MKSLFLNFFKGFLFLSFCFSIAEAQVSKAAQGEFRGGLGRTWIDGKPFYLISLTPEVSFDKIGIGLDLNLRIGTDGKVRATDWGRFYAKVIRYVRYGQKRDSLYARVGVLDYAQLGHGFIAYLYNNSPSYDDRHIGLELDVNLGDWGFESMFSDISFSRAGIFGVRGYVRPLKYTTLSLVPVIGDIEVGGTYVGDFNENAGITNLAFNPITKTLTKTDVGSIQIFGLDVGFPILNFQQLHSTLYVDYAKIRKFGSGGALGIDFSLRGLGLVNLFSKLERRFLGNQFLPSYFNAFYELERYTPASPIQSKAQLLNNTINAGNGIYGELLVDVLGFIHVRGSYQRLDKSPRSGILHLETGTGHEIPYFYAQVGYDKKNVGNETAIFKVDQNSLLHCEIGYRPINYLVISLLYQWTFAPVTDAQGNISYKTQKRIEPKATLVYTF